MTTLFADLAQYPVFAFLLVVGLIFVGILVWYIGLRAYEKASDLYWKRVLAEGARMAREHPEWLAEAIVEHDIVPADTKEIAVVRPHRMPILSVETVPRKELERYAHRLESEFLSVRAELRQCMDRNTELEHELEWAMDWKGKHWRRIQRIDEALKDDGDVFAAVHPRLAREQAS